MTIRRLRRLAALTAVTVVATAGLASIPLAAQAADSDYPSNWGTTLGELHIEPSSGSFSADTPITRAWTDAGFGASQRGGAYITVEQTYNNNGTPVHREGWFPETAVTNTITGRQANENTDLTSAFNITNFGGLTLKHLSANAGTLKDLSDGKGTTFAIILHGFRNDSSFFDNLEQKYVANGVIEGDTWRIVSTTAPAKTDTTTTLATSAITGSSATVTATVAPSDATGTVQFKQGGTAVGTPVAVSGGTAQTTLTGLSAGTSYAVTAEYSGDSKYNASTGSVSVKTADPIATAPVTVGVTVPTATTAGPTGLKLTAPSSSITLNGSGTRTSGQVWTATGSLDTVTVNDDRQNASAGGWTLNGRISALTSGSNSIAASNVGWKPEKVDGSGTAGAEVTAGANGGLGADKPFATGNASADANVATKVKATVTLTTPAEAPSGDYTGTLTLTLI